MFLFEFREVDGTRQTVVVEGGRVILQSVLDPFWTQGRRGWGLRDTRTPENEKGRIWRHNHWSKVRPGVVKEGGPLGRAHIRGGVIQYRPAQ